MTYAFARELNPQTGDWPYVASGTFVHAASPALEIVKRVLRTPRGSCPLDPAAGVDWTQVDPIGTNAEAAAESMLRSALTPLVQRGVISDLRVVSVRVDRELGRLLYELAFVDVRLRQRRTFSGASA